MNKVFCVIYNLSIIVVLRRKYWLGKLLGWIFLYKVVEKIIFFGFFYYRYDILFDFVNKGLFLVYRDIIN